MLTAHNQTQLENLGKKKIYLKIMLLPNYHIDLTFDCLGYSCTSNNLNIHIVEKNLNYNFLMSFH